MNGDGAPSVALIGDSFANHFSLGLSEQYTAHGKIFLHLGRGSCPPLLDIASRYANGREHCTQPTTGNAIEEVARLKSVNLVILAANWHLYTNGFRYADIGKKYQAYEIRSTKYPALDNNAEVFRRSLSDTVELLESQGKKVVLISQLPEINVMPVNCISVPPAFRYVNVDACRSAYTIQKRYLQESSQYLDEILIQHPKVVVIKPEKYFCDDQFCYSKMGDSSLYRDVNHLSVFGSRYVAQKIFSENKDLLIPK